MDAFVAYHSVTASDHQVRFTDLSSKGYRLISLSVYGDPSNARYAAVWVQRSGPAWQGFHGGSASEYQNFFDTWKAKGYYPVLISATGEGGKCYFRGHVRAGKSRSMEGSSRDHAGGIRIGVQCGLHGQSDSGLLTPAKK